MNRYNTCQCYKNRSEAPVGKLMPNTILEKPQSYILADFITKLPLARSYNAILVLCLEITWSSRKYYIEQRSTVCSRNDKRIEQAAKDLNKAINSLLFSNRQTNREDQSKARTIPEGLY